METNSATLIELFQLIILLGSLVFIFATIYQYYVAFNAKIKPSKIFAIIIVSRICAILLSLLIMKVWHFNFDIMQSVFFIPALISEVIISPAILKLVGIKLWI